MTPEGREVLAQIRRTTDAADAYDAAGRATYWNGEPTYATRCRAIVGTAPETWWCADLTGQQIDAVLVEYGGDCFLIDDRDGSGWRKVTEGKGSPRWSHASLPPDSKYVAGSRPAPVVPSDGSGQR